MMFEGRGFKVVDIGIDVPEERFVEAAVQEKAAKLAERKKEVLSPKKRKPRKSKAERIRELVKQAQKSGMKLDEIAEKLGMPLSE